MQNENLASSGSRVEDADNAAGLAQQTGSMILQNAGLASRSQARIFSRMIKQLIK